MAKIELAPFGDFASGVSGNTSDSIVGLVQNPVRDNQVIVKWNRRYIETEEEGLKVCKFINQSVALYKAVLGEEFVVPTGTVLGAKKDRYAKFKVFIVQKYVEGWTGRTLPVELCQDPTIAEQWNLLNSRLFDLYNSARLQNYGQAVPFPIGITLGSSRSKSYLGQLEAQIPTTPNILIDAKTHKISVCDFGPYLEWQEDMRPAYNAILQGVRR